MFAFEVSLLLLYVVSLLLAGFLLSRWIFERDRPIQAELWLPLSFGLGMGLQAACHLSSILVFGKIHTALFWGVVVALAIASIAGNKHASPLANYRGFELLKGPETPRVRSLYWFAVASIVIFAGIFYYNALSYPMASYDGRAIWNYKAIILFHDRTPITEVFVDAARVHYHRDYPLLVPLTQFGLYEMLGRPDEELVRFVSTSLYLMFLLYMTGILQRVGTRQMAILFALVFGGMPFREYWVIRDAGAINSGEADFTLAFYGMMAVFSMFQWWQEQRRSHLILSAFFCGCALMTKKEGLIVFAVLMGASGLQWLFGAGIKRGPAFARLLAAGALAVAVALPWVLVSRHLPNLYDEDFAAMFTARTFSYVPRRLMMVIKFALNDISDLEKWNAVWYFYFVTVALGASWWFRRRFFFLDGVIAVWLLAYAVVYCFSPLALTFHLNTSLRRLLSHLFPIVLLQLGFFWSARRRAGSLFAEPQLRWSSPEA